MGGRDRGKAVGFTEGTPVERKNFLCYDINIVKNRRKSNETGGSGKKQRRNRRKRHLF